MRASSWILPTLALFAAAPAAAGSVADAPGGQFTCASPRITDGDTLRCGERRVRLANIDAPEMEGRCRPGRRCTPGDPIAARDHLRRLARGPLACRIVDIDHYGRTVARCSAGGRDLSCAMVAARHAVPRYGRLRC